MLVNGPACSQLAESSFLPNKRLLSSSQAVWLCYRVSLLILRGEKAAVTEKRALSHSSQVLDAFFAIQLGTLRTSLKVFAD